MPTNDPNKNPQKDPNIAPQKGNQGDREKMPQRQPAQPGGQLDPNKKGSAIDNEEEVEDKDDQNEPRRP